MSAIQSMRQSLTLNTISLPYNMYSVDFIILTYKALILLSILQSMKISRALYFLMGSSFAITSFNFNM